MEIRIRRVYEKPTSEDGRRILVDRLWPRGLSKGQAKVDFWARDISPSTGLRRWYGHDPEKWPEFKSKYFNELDANPQGVQALLAHMGEGTVTFVYSSKEERLNNAVALKEYIESVIVCSNDSGDPGFDACPGPHGVLSGCCSGDDPTG